MNSRCKPFTIRCIDMGNQLWMRYRQKLHESWYNGANIAGEALLRSLLKYQKAKGFFRRASLPTENTHALSNCDLRRFKISVQSLRWFLQGIRSLPHVLIISSQNAVEPRVVCAAENVRFAGEGCVTETNSS